MNQKEMEDFIIRSYQQDEQMMILIFAQWCVNRELDPVAVYQRAYPNQGSNPALLGALESTVPKSEADDITDDMLFTVLSLFDNEQLAAVCAEEQAILAEKQKKSSEEDL